MNTHTADENIDPTAPLAPSGRPWAYGLRTCGPKGEAYNGFTWPTEKGAVVSAPDFDPSPTCGGGLHLNPWGMGDWSLHSYHASALWMVVRYDPALAVELDGGERGGKIKAPWAIVEQVETRENLARLLGPLAVRRIARIKEITCDAATTGYAAHAATTGYAAHAATTGYAAHAATTGDAAHAATTGDAAHAATTGGRAHAATTGGRAHAATTGGRAHAATTGDAAHAATTGGRAHAATTGDDAISASLGIDARAKAGAGGAIMLAEYGWRPALGKYELVAVFASKVGEGGIEPDTWYKLEGGKPVAIEVSP
jgi:hypothetical protein